MRNILGLALIATCATACAGGAGGAGASGSAPLSAIPAAARIAHPAAVTAMAAATGSDAPVYISTSGNHASNDAAIYVYQDNGKALPKLGITMRPKNPNVMALDALGNLYVGQFTGTSSTQNSAVRVFSPGGTSLIRDVPVPGVEIDNISLDAAGNLYVLGNDETGFTLDIFAPGTNTPTELPSIGRPIGMAVAPNGTLYLPYVAGSGTIQIAVYSSGSTSPSYTFSYSGLNTSLAIDSSGNLYATSKSGVLVYTPGSTTPSYTLSSGSAPAWMVTLDSSNDLYVANTNTAVVAYAPGATTPSYTIPPTRGDALRPTILSMATDPFGNLCTITIENNNDNIVSYYHSGTGKAIGRATIQAAGQVVIGPRAE